MDIAADFVAVVGSSDDADDETIAADREVIRDSLQQWVKRGSTGDARSEGSAKRAKRGSEEEGAPPLPPLDGAVPADHAQPKDYSDNEEGGEVLEL